MNPGNYGYPSYTTSGTNITAQATGYYPAYPQQGFQPPPSNWHTFYPCGHQVKLEPGQPAPPRCSVCPAPEQKHHEYRGCGHVWNYLSDQQLPAECPTCASKKQAEVNAKAEAEKLAQEERAAREAEDADPIAWLDRNLYRENLAA